MKRTDRAARPRRLSPEAVLKDLALVCVFVDEGELRFGRHRRVACYDSAWIFWNVMKVVALLPF